MRILGGESGRLAVRWLVLGLWAGPMLMACAGEKDSKAEPSLMWQNPYGMLGQAGVGSTQAGSCQVAQVLAQHCHVCHGTTPVAGAPMSLVTYADLIAPAKSDPTRAVVALLQQRVHASVKPMPPQGQLATDQLAIIDQWLAAGAPDCGFGLSTGLPDPMQPEMPIETPDAAVPDTDAGPVALVPEQCFELRAHGGVTPGDTSAYPVRPGEHYREFHFKAPYAKAMKLLTGDTLIDNAGVLHHWLLYQAGTPAADGSHEDGIGAHPTGDTLITGWAPGGNPPDMPPGVAQELPPVGGDFTLEIHYYNTTGAMQMDRSGVKLCVTSQPVENTATLTWLGTETIYVPAGSTGTAIGTCTPLRKGLAADQDIHIITATPHMHKIGTHMKTVINRKAGGSEVLVDEAFAFMDQRTYERPTLLHPGDTLTTTCTYQNTGSGTVGFGPSSDSEMCYDFVLSYPAHALEGVALSISAATNTCLQ